MSKQILGKVVPQKGTDYWTDTDKEEIVQEVNSAIEDKKQDYIDNANTYIEELTTLKNSQLEEFNNNATNKTSEINTLVATEKTNIEELSDEKQGDLTTLASTLNSSINTNASNKTSDFNANVQEKTSQFNSNAATQTLQFTQNVTTKEGEYNTNATTKVNEFNQNVTTKLGELTTATSTAIEDIGTEKTNAISNINETKSTCISDIQDKADEVINEIENYNVNGGHVYGIRRKITDNSSSNWERILDSIGKVANATHDGTEVQNDFDNLAPWREIKTCNYDITNNKIKAWIDDFDFKFDGTNGDVYTHIPKTYWKIYQEDDYDYVLLADYPKSGFIEIDDFFISRYTGRVVDNTIRSYSGIIPTSSKTIEDFRTLVNALGNKFSQLDWRYFVLQNLYLVEYADYDSQTMLGKGISLFNPYEILVAENGTNRVIISNPDGLNVGMTIRIGTASYSNNIADERKIVSIDEYNNGSITGYSIAFNGDSINVSVGNYISTMGQESGQCDNLAMKSGCYIDDYYHSMTYRGIENIFGNIFQFLDGINIKDYEIFICKNHANYTSNKFDAPYKKLSYNSNNTNGFIKSLGYDVDEPLLRLQTQTGGNSNTYMCDQSYQNSGNRIATVGGNNNKSGNGLWCIYTQVSNLSNSWGIGTRILIDGKE